MRPSSPESSAGCSRGSIGSSYLTSSSSFEEFRSPCRGLRNSKAELPPVRGTRGRALVRNERKQRAYTNGTSELRWELGFSGFSPLKTENRPSLSGRFSCPAVGRARRQASGSILSPAEGFVTGEL